MASGAKDKESDIKESSKFQLSACSDQENVSEFSITNPFEDNTVDSLLQPSFSPSVFNSNGSSGTEGQTTPNSFWNLEQIAVLNPMDIDLSALHTQQDFLRLDPASERRAQHAIDEFFASHIEMRSPWSAERPNNHYLALISPSPAQMKKKPNFMTPSTGRPGFSSSSATSSLSSSSQIRVRRLQLNASGKNPPSTSKSVKSLNAKQKAPPESKNASTQTTLTLPKDFDLETILKQYYTFGQVTENQNDTLNNTSLRRKLFFPDGRGVEMHNKDGELNLNALQHVDDLQDLDKFAESSVPLHKIQPDNNNLTPLIHGGQGDVSRTPSTCQSHFSSSPVMSGMGFDPNTPCSSNSQRPRFGSGIRRRKMLLGSSEDEELIKMQFEAINSPELSPVKCDVFTEGKGQVRDIESLAVDESMSFRVSDSNPGEKMALESDSNHPPAMESSRRQLVLESPTLSPICPLKVKSKATESSSNRVAKTAALTVQSRQLCPSPMLSPIPCKNSSKSDRSNDQDSQRKVTPSLLSSTVTRPIVTSATDLDTPAKSGQNSGISGENLRPFQSYEKPQFSHDHESNKENIFPTSSITSSMFLSDVSMPLDLTSNNQDMCNDIYMQADEHSTSVLYCNQNDSNPVQTSSNWNQPSQKSIPGKPLASKPGTIITMDTNMHCRPNNAFDDSVNSQNPTECQGDSGYSTTQSQYRYQVV